MVLLPLVLAHLDRSLRFFAGVLAAVAALGFVVSLSGSAATLLLIAGAPVLLLVLLAGSVFHNLHGTQMMVGKPPRGSTLAVLAVPAMLVGTLMLAWPVFGAGVRLGSWCLGLFG